MGRRRDKIVNRKSSIYAPGIVNSSGFTLIELLVVIAIIALLLVPFPVSEFRGFHTH
jgi:prepilin-type N-terminal cleavage/methylation domain-containing protein